MTAMGINDVIVYVMAVFAGIGALDKMLGNRFGLGKKFEEGLGVMADLSLVMVGILTISPVLGQILTPVVVPVFQALGADPGMFGGCLLSNDSGAVALAQTMTTNQDVADFSGFIVGGMMGMAITFTIPVSMEMSGEEDRDCVLKGLLAGIITIPVGCLTGGLAAGYPISLILPNITPILLLAAFVVLGLWRFPKVIIKGFTWFGKLMMCIIVLGLGAGIVEALTGFVVIPGMNPVLDAFVVVVEIAMFLAGAYPLMHVVTKVFRGPLALFGRKIEVNETAVAGMLATLVNSIPMFGMVKDMDARGKVVNIAFAVSAGFALGDHLGFTAGVNPQLLVPVVVGKLTGGVTAVAAALWMTRR